jgi:hypothetical protein
MLSPIYISNLAIHKITAASDNNFMDKSRLHDTQQNDIQHNDTQHEGLYCDT